MKENKLTIQISCPVSEVFEFTINPDNTPRWIDSIEKEWSTDPLEIGTKYTNKNKEGVITEYIVSDLVLNKIFELKSDNFDYKVRYTYEALGEDKTQLEYFEWVTMGDLNNPFKIEVLKKLKEIIENK